jgi:hypothetical protein
VHPDIDSVPQSFMLKEHLKSITKQVHFIVPYWARNVQLLSTNAEMGLVWAVYHFCTMLTKEHRLHLKFAKKKRANGLGCWFTDRGKILEGLDKYVAYHHFKFFENVQFGISTSQHHIPGTASAHGSHKKCEDLRWAELVNYILEPI